MQDRLDQLSERIERSALESLHRHCPEETRALLGLKDIAVGDVLAGMASNDSSVLINRAQGLGTREPVTRETIASVIEAYRAHSADRFFFHVYPETLPEPAWLGELGLTKVRGWRKFHRDLSEPPERQTDLTIRQIGLDDAAHFGRIVADAFGMTDAAAPLLGGLARDERWRLFMSFDGSVPAGAGGIFIENGCGFLEWAATDPTFRRRGSQGAIMAARIRAAIEEGCTHLFTETGESVAGDPQHSYRNILRFGFEEGSLRENWAPA